VQALVLPNEHWPQAPEAWQAGAAPPHSASPVQARHVWVVVLQTGATPLHWALDVHGTHVPVVVRQAGVLPVHLVALVAEQAPQAPEGWQAGLAPPHSPSPEQARQVCVDRLHTGAAPPH
jgi:hypothetical protein